MLRLMSRTAFREEWLVRLRRVHSWEVILSFVGLALVAGALRLTLILRYPLLYDTDAYGRWLARDHPFSSPWVPLFQVCLFVLTRIADSIVAVRLLSACFGVTAVLGLWLLLRHQFGEITALLAALLLALFPLFVLFTIVPYQEGLFLTLAFLTLWLGLRPDPPWGWLTLLTGLAALTRYEGWLLALILWALLLWRRWRANRLTWRYLVGSALALSLAPLLWIGINRNVSPVGAQTLSPTLDPASLGMSLDALWTSWRLNLGLAGDVVMLGGLAWLMWQSFRGNELARAFLLFLLGDLLLIAFLRPFSPGNLRIPLLSLPILLSGVAGLMVDGGRFVLGRLSRQGAALSLRLLFSILCLALLLVWLVPLSFNGVAGYNALVRPAFLAAQALPESLPPGATIAVLGGGSILYALPVYAQQDGRQVGVVGLDVAASNSPASLAAALCATKAQALIVAGLTSITAVNALSQRGFLLPIAKGPGYALWRVPPRFCTLAYTLPKTIP